MSVQHAVLANAALYQGILNTLEKISSKCVVYLTMDNVSVQPNLLIIFSPETLLTYPSTLSDLFRHAQGRQISGHFGLRRYPTDCKIYIFCFSIYDSRSLPCPLVAHLAIKNFAPGGFRGLAHRKPERQLHTHRTIAPQLLGCTSSS